MNKLEVILDEQKFPYEGISLEERNYYLNVIKNCKDINDSVYKIDGESRCELLELHFRKCNNQIKINGSLSIGTDKFKEYRTLDGYIFTQNNSIVVDMHIIRLNNLQEYTVLDEFKVVNNKLMRNSFYNHDMKIVETEIKNRIMRGK